MTTIDNVYAQRNELAIAFAKAALAAGWKAGRGIDSEASPEWANVVYVDLPDGRQVSWHMSPDCVPLLDGLPQYAGTWDGTFVGREAGWSRGIKAVAQQAEPVTVSVDALAQHIRVVDGNHSLGAGALAEKIVEFLIERGIGKEQAEPVTIERLRDALVASRIIPPAAVEDPEGYDDGVTLYRIEALHRRIT